VRESAWVLLSPGAEFGDGPGRVAHTGGVVDEGELGQPPGRFHSIDRHREVDDGGRLVDPVDQPHGRQLICEGSIQEALLLQSQKVGTVDPNQVDRAVLVVARRLLSTPV